MIDQWFKADLCKTFDVHPVLVFIDESAEAEFLLRTLGSDYAVHRTATDLEELHVKYLIEKSDDSTLKHIIYTQRPRKTLKFIREYCETNGCLEIRNLQAYVKGKVHQELNLNINLPREALTSAAKVSVGKDRTYWMDLTHKGAGEIFDLSKELLPFLHNPEAFDRDQYDAQIRETFYKHISSLLGVTHTTKPATTRAKEVVKAMLDGLAHGNCKPQLLSIYKDWLDSVSYQESFLSYLSDYSLPVNAVAVTADINHPFEKLDEQWMIKLGAKISNPQHKLEDQVLEWMRKRSQSKQAMSLGISFWADVVTILEFDLTDINQLNSLDECSAYYTHTFCKLDTAIRNLYAAFLDNTTLLHPIQNLYREHVSVFLNKWFQYWSEYRENQTGLLQRIINESPKKTAIIVGDGVAYEIANLVADKVSSGFDLKKESIFADIPSETENNMSRLYMDNGVTEAVQKNREKYLQQQNPDVPIDFLPLDKVSDGPLPNRILVCTYKDIDDMGEKLQHKALKYFPETIDFFAKKITQLLNNGYGKVCLITDHGFVLTGILSEHDKITHQINGDCHKAERYLRTADAQPHLNSEMIEVHRSYKQFNHLYFAKNLNPFKTPGVYGFSHGGLAPQEVVVPFFTWTNSSAPTNALTVEILHKADLKGITGNNYSVTVQAGTGDGELFSHDRKLCLLFFSNQEQVGKSDIFTLKSNQSTSKEFEFDGHSTIDMQLLDAETKELLDSATTTQNNDRDLGGLL
jgi:hypothetical protein